MTRQFVMALVVALFFSGCFWPEGYGGDGDPCFGNETCAPGLVCSNGLCLKGGGEGQPCFDNGRCNPGLVCDIDICKPRGEMPDGDKPDGDIPDGDTPDGDTDGDTPDGDNPDGDTDGDTPDGDNPDGDDPDGDTDGDADGDTPDGDTDGDTPDGDTDGDLPCVCTSGPCCDGCHYRDTEHVCQARVSGTAEYRCSSVDCGAVLEVRHQDRTCSGESSSCNGELIPGEWETSRECTSIQHCNAGTASCITDRPNCDPTYCVFNSGPCCDNATSSLHTSEYACALDVENEYGCPDGESCGFPVKRRFRDRLCDGLTHLCPTSGHLGDWKAWETVDTCSDYEVCVPGATACELDRPLCDPLWCNAGACCDLGLETLYGASQVCETGIESGVLRCTQEGCGAEIEEMHRQRLCDGENPDCVGELVDTDDWALVDTCTTSQRCHPQNFVCEPYSFHDEARCDGLARYWYNTCDVREEMIENCDDGELCSFDICAPGGCTNTPYTCHGHGTCGGNDYCTCTHAAYTGDFCDLCAHDYYEFPLDSGICIDDPCDPDPDICNGNGVCDNSTGVATCDCKPGFVGAACDTCHPDALGVYPLCFLPGAGYCTAQACFRVPPTGQDRCHTWGEPWEEVACPGGIPAVCGDDPPLEGCGQDAQYGDDNRIFTCYSSAGVEEPCAALVTAQEHEIVTDSVTGLMWQRYLPGTYEGCTGGDPAGARCNWQGAKDYCDMLIYAGYSDWRLPGPHELMSMMDSSRYNPAIDLTVFPGTPPAPFWTSAASGGVDAWRLWFTYVELSTSGMSQNSFARCVRSGPPESASASPSRFIRSEGGTPVITDSVTGMIWQPSYVEGKTWVQALDWCESSTYAGKTDWRLPDLNDLVSIMRHEGAAPYSDLPLDEFPDGFLWSSTTRIGMVGHAGIIDTRSGNVFSWNKLVPLALLCARGGPGLPCDDDDPCTFGETYDFFGDCGGGTPYVCDDNSSCDGLGGCMCHPGYIEFPAESDLCIDDPCDPDPDICNGNGVCDNSTGVATCDCDPSFQNAACDECGAGSIWSYPNCFVPGMGFCAGHNCSPIVPTGQDRCYTWGEPWEEVACPGGIPAVCGDDPPLEGCGQDAQYGDDSRIFTCYSSAGVETPCAALVTAQEHEIITDSVTGLMWQRYLPGTYEGCTGGDPAGARCNWQGAKDYCDMLIYAEYSDWRLPTPHELLSIVDNGRFGPAIYTAQFPGTPASPFWSSVTQVDTADLVWAADFNNGNVAGIDVWSPAFARCVRSGADESPAGSPASLLRFGEPGEELLADSVTGLFWQKEYVTDKTWWEALAYCEALSYGGYTDWRLPDKNELASLINYARFEPASDVPDTPPYSFLSSSSRAQNPDLSWSVQFKYGIVSIVNKSSAFRARCVRGGPGLPCDDGDPCTYGEVYDLSGDCRGGTAYSCNAHGTCDGNGGCRCDYGFAGNYCDACDPAFALYPLCDGCHPDAIGQYPACFLPAIGYCDSNLCWPVTPGGQRSCYTWESAWQATECPGGIPASCGEDPPIAGCGQDAQYPDNWRIFTCFDASGDETPCSELPTTQEHETVSDSLTGLVWQRHLPSSYAGCSGGSPVGATCTWQEASDYCASLSYADESDWRLPNAHELLSLADASFAAPAIDLRVFPGTPSTIFWTSSRSGSDYFRNYVWFGSGSSNRAGLATLYAVRCVRGGKTGSASGSFDNFVLLEVGGDQMVWDRVTGLIWQKNMNPGASWGDSLALCEDLEFGGESDWRLPSKLEVASIIDYAGASPLSRFPGILGFSMWSSTTVPATHDRGFGVSMGYGEMSAASKSGTSYYRCVRSGPGAPCDDGDPCTYGEVYDLSGDCRGGTAVSCNAHGTCDGNGGCRCDAAHAGESCDACSELAFGSYPDCYVPDAATCAASACFGLTPTKLTTCHDNNGTIPCGNIGGVPANCQAILYCGQDAQHPDPDRDLICYNVSGVERLCGQLPTAQSGEVVEDEITGLIWQRDYQTSVSGSNAAGICAALNSSTHAGRTDWRLPTVHELFSLVEDEPSNPSIDALAFPDTSGSFWTATLQAQDNSMRWYILFSYGLLGTSSASSSRNVRCVSGGYEGLESAIGERYHVGSQFENTWVHDAFTGLTWTNLTGSKSWPFQMDSCEPLNRFTFTDWRMPNRKELLTLVDFGSFSPASTMPLVATESYWTASPHVGAVGNAWSLDFEDGLFVPVSMGTSQKTLCVRGGL